MEITAASNSIKQKAINGLAWSFFDSLVGQGSSFVVGILLARMLTPREFGLIAMPTIFIAISTSFIDSGFTQALIQKKNPTPEDYATVFYYNLIVGFIYFAILFGAAPLISDFYREPELKPLVRLLGLVLIIDALSMIQRTTLIKRIDFKLKTRISLISSLLSGAVAIAAAHAGCGIWSLAFKTVSAQGANSALLWIWNRWRPIRAFRWQAFKELFSFGSKLLLSNLINTAYENIYYLIIGKFFSAAELGFYTQANTFKNIPSQNINGIINRVSYPVLATLQDNPDQLKAGYKRLITSTMLITFVMMIGMAAVAEPMILILIGEQWRSSIVYLQMLCFVGMLYPLHSLNLNMLNVKGRSDLFLKLEIAKKILAIPTIIIGFFCGIKIMIAGMIFNSLLAYFLNSYWSGKLIDYSMQEQIVDILPSFVTAFVMGIIVYLFGLLLPINNFWKLSIQVVIGTCITCLFCELLRMRSYLYLKEILLTNTCRIARSAMASTFWSRS